MILHCNLVITRMHLEAFSESRIVIVAGTGGTLNNVSNIPQDRGKTDSSIRSKKSGFRADRLIFSFLSEVEDFYHWV